MKKGKVLINKNEIMKNSYRNLNYWIGFIHLNKWK